MRALLAVFAAAAALPLSAAITGTVVDSNGAPVANVRIDAYRPLQQYYMTALFAKLADAKPLASTQSDAKGAFTIDLPGYGVADVHATADGYAPADVFAAYDDSTSITLRKAATVTGTATANGKPVADATVFVMSNDGFPLIVKTDAKGAFRIPDPKSWAQYIAVLHPDYAPAAHPSANLTFALDAGRDVKGKVVDEKGAGVAGAEVSIDSVLTGKTGEDGAFVIRHVPANVATISAHAPNAAASMRLPSGSPTLRLKKTSRISGVVRDGSKHPLAGIAVSAGGEDEGFNTAYTDAKGAYSLDVPRGRLNIGAMGFGVYEIEGGDVDGSAGDVRRDFEAKRQAYITGVVKLRDGTPVAGAQIGMRAEAFASQMQLQGQMPVMMTPARTTADGRFRVQGAGETKVRIVALKRGLPPGESPTVTGQTAERGITITIPEGIEIRGVVKDANNHPLPGVAIDPMLGYQPEGPAASDEHEAWATSGADGTFTGQLSRGSAALNFTKKGFVPAQKMIDVAPGMAQIDVALAAGGALRGKIVKKDGTPAPETPVTIEERYAITDADGAFAIEDVEPGDYVVRFGRTMAQTKNVHVPSDDVRLVLGGTRQISGRVTDAATGAPIEQFTVIVGADEDRSMPQPVQAADGAFTVDAPETAVNVSVSAAGYVASKGVSVPPSSQAPLSVALVRGRTIRGRVTDASGQPVSDANVSSAISSYSSEYFSSDRSPQTSADGTYELTGLGFDEDVIISFRKEGFVAQQKKVRAGRDDARLDAVLSRGIAVSGRVIDPSGNGVAEVSVNASSAAHGAGYESATTENDGSFHFAGLAPGRYEFSAETMDTPMKGVVRDVDIEKLREVTIRVEKHASAIITGHVTGLDSSAIMRTVAASNEQQETTTALIDASGNFRIEVPAGVVEVRADMAGRKGSRSTRPVTVDAPPNSERRVDLAFADQVKVHGTVLRGGTPASGLTIRFEGGATDGGMANTTAEGTYEASVDPGEYDVAMYDTNRQIPFSQHVAVTSDSQIDFRIETNSIRVTVLDAATEQPLAGATLNLMHTTGTHSAGSATTGADGSAIVEIPMSEALNVTASQRGYANAVADLPAGNTSPVVLRLVRSAGALVRLVDRRDGRTLSGYVIARDDSGRVVASSYEEDPDGTVTLPLPAGRYRFSGSAEGYGSQTVVGDAGGGEVTIALPRGGAIAIRSTSDVHGTARLIQPDGEEYVRCWCNGIARIDLNGKMTIVDRISPGAYTLEVTSSGAKPRRIPVTVIEGQTLPVPID